MPVTPNFDPTPYFEIAADTLLRNFGDRALYYADEALKKMRALDDANGFDMWLNIHEHILARLKSSPVPQGVSIH
ncbi:hypothetical protein JCM17845_25490 [Iodidimonas gelatinilytica]|uniref:Uncharacterized protein n=1 Tax=Iodidimonas gelatinilytica TaxID=1236966 RepID=A0A5A7N4D6_9PROT|nr:hypothetical protein [Iodidimonas gelatinilytica]GER01926.1 hypothetical protein JCM17845_25490 [Iodidimonas gelatinilytica]